MSTFIRGPVCGIDNCPSRLWRIINGRRTCQYGHVMEGDVEFNDDEDMTAGGVVTRRLNLTTGATGNFQSSFNASQYSTTPKSDKNLKVYGYQANLLFLKCFQYVLKKQCFWLVEKRGFPVQFSHTVKTIWMDCLNSISDTEVGGTDLFSGSDEEGENFGGEDFDGFGSGSNKRKGHSKKLGYRMTTTIAILYMATMYHGLPVYICDFVDWIIELDLLYFKSSEQLPTQWKAKLPNYYLGVFEGGPPPLTGQIYAQVNKINSNIDFCDNFKCQYPYEGLILKLVTSITAFPEFYLYSIKLIEAFESYDSLQFPKMTSKHYDVYHNFPEFRIISYFILCVVWVLASNPRESYSDRMIMRYLQFLQKNAVQKKRSNLRKIYDEDCNDVYNWSDKESLDYLNWFEKKFLPLQSKDIETDPSLTVDKRIAKRQLHKLFPLNSEFPLDRHETDHLTLIDKLQNNCVPLRNAFEEPQDDVVSLPNRNKIISMIEKTLIEQLADKFAISQISLRCVMDKIKKRCYKVSDDNDVVM